MVEEKKQEIKEKKVEETKKPVEQPKEKVEEKKTEDKKKPEKKKEVPKIEKKDHAVVNAKDLRISTKHSIAICNMIKGKSFEEASKMLNEVLSKKRAVPMKGEIPHRKGMMSGRYPEKASEVFIKLIRSLAANSNINQMENPYIKMAKANIASRPYRRFGSQRFKRTNVYLESRERKQKPEKPEKKPVKEDKK